MIEFHKYHGAGNDFLLINNLDGAIKLTKENICRLSDRHFGIGADGIILIEKNKNTDCFMNYYNSDGSLAEMCGNGIRCTAKFFKEQTKSNKNELLIDTRAGVKKIICNSDDTFSVNMGKPIFESIDFPSKEISLESFNLNFVSMGNPHAVILVKNISDIDLPTIGPKIESNPIFPNKINVEFVEKVKDNYFKVKVWERGCGATLACGTGACAVYAILAKTARQNLTEKKEITLEFPGGKLYLSKNEDGNIILRGPAEYVFKGKIDLNKSFL